MQVNDLERSYEYGYWANHHLFTVIAQLSPEQFTEPVAGSYGSVRSTLVHMLSAEWGWLDRCGGTPRGDRLKAENYPTLESVTQAWNQVEGYVRVFLAGQLAMLLRMLGVVPGNFDLLIYEVRWIST